LVRAGDGEEEDGVEVDEEVVYPGDGTGAADGGELNSLYFIAVFVILLQSMVVPSNWIAVQPDSLAYRNDRYASMLHLSFNVAFLR